MKKKNAGIALGLLCAGLFSCTDQYTICSLSKSVTLEASFYEYPASGTAVARNASSFTLSPIFGAPTAYNQFPNAANFALSLNPGTDSVVYRIRLSESLPADTISFVYSTTERNLSYECGSINVHQLFRVYATNHTIDSISITHPEITNMIAENVRIFF
ncbi:MAG: hypothetical protein EOO88_51080 [Pedobacter sp.]|nr:MAG: hypothetical protein EOO88_51080 [Pedobacter sp.]